MFCVFYHTYKGGEAAPISDFNLKISSLKSAVKLLDKLNDRQADR